MLPQLEKVLSQIKVPNDLGNCSESYEEVVKKLNNTSSLIKYFMVVLNCLSKSNDARTKDFHKLLSITVPVYEMELMVENYEETKNPSFFYEKRKKDKWKIFMRKVIDKYAVVFGGDTSLGMEMF